MKELNTNLQPSILASCDAPVVPTGALHVLEKAPRTCPRVRVKPRTRVNELSVHKSFYRWLTVECFTLLLDGFTASPVSPFRGG